MTMRMSKKTSRMATRRGGTLSRPAALASRAQGGGLGGKKGLTFFPTRDDALGNRLTPTELDAGWPTFVSSAYAANSLNQYTCMTGSAGVPPAQTEDFSPTFDDDGNQTQIKTATGIWSVTYNGENRPVLWSNGMTNITMKFDRMGRRVEYLETADIDGITTTNAHHRFVYDGYLCIQRLDAASNNAIDLIFAWDPSEPVATRPLMIEKPNVCKLHVTHDGNKNVSELVFFSGGTGFAAHYEYAPFGALTASTRNSTSTAYDFRTYNPFRFSSEYADDALGLVYYNYRHYEPVMGRWLSRDPIEESGGANLYGFIANRIGLEIDSLGCNEFRTKIYLHPVFKPEIRSKRPKICAPGKPCTDTDDDELVRRMTSFDKVVDVGIQWDGYCTKDEYNKPVIDDVELSHFNVVGYVDYLSFSLADALPFGHKVNKLLTNAGIEVNLEIGSGWYLKVKKDRQTASKRGESECISRDIHIEVIERRVKIGVNASATARIGGKNVSTSLGGADGVSWDVPVANQVIRIMQCCCPSTSEVTIVGGQNIDSEGIDQSETGRPRPVSDAFPAAKGL